MNVLVMVLCHTSDVVAGEMNDMEVETLERSLKLFAVKGIFI